MSPDGGSSDGRCEHFWRDRALTMGRANRLRERHFDQLLTELYELIPDTEFTLGRLQ